MEDYSFSKSHQRLDMGYRPECRFDRMDSFDSGSVVARCEEVEGAKDRFGAAVRGGECGGEG